MRNKTRKVVLVYCSGAQYYRIKFRKTKKGKSVFDLPSKRLEGILKMFGPSVLEDDEEEDLYPRGFNEGGF